MNFKLVLKINLKTVRKEDQIKCTTRGTKETMEIRAEITKQIRKNNKKKLVILTMKET